MISWSSLSLESAGGRTGVVEAESKMKTTKTTLRSCIFAALLVIGLTASPNCYQHPNNLGECDEGCLGGFFGDYCNKTCPQHCAGRRGDKHAACSQDIGQCLSGCVRGWYGNNCSKRCSKHCSTGVCNMLNGDCIDGCKGGFFGLDCKYKCNARCQGGVCNGDGTCDCKAGFAGRYCDFTCSTDCSGSECSVGEGAPVCSKGCVPGFTGRYCQQLCPEDCQRNLCHQNGSCVSDTEPRALPLVDAEDNICLHHNPNTGLCDCCRTGWTGNNCNTKCDNCGHRSVQNNGTHECKDSCTKGTYGVMCNETCSKTCADGSCHTKSGNCPGCVLGYYGERCDKKCDRRCLQGGCYQHSSHCKLCPYERYGSFCEDKCSFGCAGERCNKRTGECLHGCKQGYLGKKCIERSSKGCSTSEYRLPGRGHYRCVGRSCEVGFTGEDCRSHCSKCGYGCYKQNATCTSLSDQGFHDDPKTVLMSVGVSMLVLIAVVHLIVMIVKILKNWKYKDYHHLSKTENSFAGQQETTTEQKCSKQACIE
ncbi:multiple epidermal growth factor-like domains protein 10 isoform X2 [Haliotis rufescens]|uniref:multiple epidermal growth factor-like domains protein 10 isoform X2 n=1 Tax=Haliotis rufescens TaxID=6454 RepID=UPI00201EA007|nr:multiple epidermal growth factor-like domains protein 10 isoform X2 [Haliotis rufescens]